MCVCVVCVHSDSVHMQRAPVHGSNWDIFIRCLVDISFLGHSFLVYTVHLYTEASDFKYLSQHLETQEETVMPS